MQTDSVEQTVRRLTAEGWELVHRDDKGAQLRRPKSLNRLGLLLALLLLAASFLANFVTFMVTGTYVSPLVPFYLRIGAGVVLVLVIAMYVVARDELRYIAAADRPSPHS